MMSSSAKSMMKLMMKQLLSKLVHADGEEDGSGGRDEDEDGGPWTAEYLQCSLVYFLRYYSRHIK